MSEHLLFWKGNRNPSIEETITVDGAPYDLNGATVRFKMRPVGSATLKVDQLAQVVTPPGTNGQVRYDWAAADVDTAGQFLVWWEITRAGKTQDLNEALIEFRAHDDGQLYIELEQLKSTLNLTGDTFADQDIQLAILAASRSIDQDCGRRFYPDADANQVHYYAPLSERFVRIDDLVELTSLKTDPNGDATYAYTWTLGSDFTLEPSDAVALGHPWQLIRKNALAAYTFDFAVGYANPIKVTGRFGWLAVPPQIQQATVIRAGRLLKRARETPFGVAALGLDGAAVRVARDDPDVTKLIAPFVRGSGPSGMGLA